MADGRKNNGGARPGAGRKPKAEEAKIIENMDSHINQDEVWKKMAELIKEGDTRALTLYLNYRFGKPKETVAQTIEYRDFSIEDLVKFRD